MWDLRKQSLVTTTDSNVKDTDTLSKRHLTLIYLRHFSDPRNLSDVRGGRVEKERRREDGRVGGRQGKG